MVEEAEADQPSETSTYCGCGEGGTRKPARQARQSAKVIFASRSRYLQLRTKKPTKIFYLAHVDLAPDLRPVLAC